MSKFVPLSEQESARTGFTHVLNLKVTGAGTGDIATVGAVQNITAVPIGTVCQSVGVDVKQVFTGMTTPTLDVAFANTGTGGTNILAAASLSAANNAVVANPTAAVTTASQFITVRNNGSVASASAGEVNVYLRLVDITAGRNTFP